MKVHIIQSLSSKEVQTGELTKIFLTDAEIDYNFNKVSSKLEFINVLANIKNEPDESEYVYIHIDCHGDKEKGRGIVIYDNSDSKELVEWHELRYALRRIYEQTNKKTVMCLSVCKGYKVAQLVARNEPCPYAYVCGSFKRFAKSEGYVCFTKFYKLISEGANVLQAAETIQNDKKCSGMGFIAYSAEKMFELMFRAYLRDHWSNEMFEKKKLDAINKLRMMRITITSDLKKKVEYKYSDQGQKEIWYRRLDTFLS